MELSLLHLIAATFVLSTAIAINTNSHENTQYRWNWFAQTVLWQGILLNLLIGFGAL